MEFLLSPHCVVARCSNGGRLAYIVRLQIYPTAGGRARLLPTLSPCLYFPRMDMCQNKCGYLAMAVPCQFESFYSCATFDSSILGSVRQPVRRAWQTDRPNRESRLHDQR